MKRDETNAPGSGATRVHADTRGRTGMYRSPKGLSETRPRLMSILVLLLLLPACDEVLEVERSPSQIPGDQIVGESSFRARYIGAAALFADAVGVNTVYGGLFTDELLWSGSFPNRDEIDRRSIDPANDIVADEPYTALQRAAKVAKDLQREMLEGLYPNIVPNPEPSAELAQVSLFSGYTRLYLADLFCTLAFDGVGPELNAQDVYSQAIEDFTRAIDAAEADEQVRNAALVGRARARMQRGDFEGALADAQQVPVGFEYAVEYSQSTSSNNVWSFTRSNRRLPVSFEFRGLKIDDTEVDDPRPGTEDIGRPSFSGSDRAWSPRKYADQFAPILIASWEEAQFMIAEIQGGDVARDIINELRALNGVSITWDAAGEATDEEILRKVIDEKGRTMLLEGHRMGDFSRYLTQYGIDLFPTGEGFGNQTCMPLPNKERHQNPGL